MRLLSKVSILTAISLILLSLTVPLMAADDTEKLPSPDEFVAVESMPEMISITQPEYPPEALKKGIEGKVFIRSLVNKKGVPVKSEVVKSSGSELLDKAALNAAKSSEFKPAMQNRQPVAIWVTYYVVFKDGKCDTGMKSTNPPPPPDKDSFVPVDQAPELVYQEKPEYPAEAYDKGIEGVVIIKALVGSDGIPQKVEIGKSSGNDLLDKAALKAAKKNKYKPALQDDKPVATWIQYKVEFTN